MSTRALALLVLVLAVLLAVSGRLALRRLGYIDVAPPPEWTFVNPLLEVAEGTRVVVRPITAGQSGVRYYFGPRIDVPDAEPGVDPPEAFVPHLRLGVEQKGEGEEVWGFVGVQYLLLSQLGALTPKEWLIELGPVLERGDGGRRRTLLRATYGHESGAQVHYFTDPADPRRLERGFGWLRNEMRAPEQPPDASFTEPAGFTPPR